MTSRPRGSSRPTSAWRWSRARPSSPSRSSVPTSSGSRSARSSRRSRRRGSACGRSRGEVKMIAPTRRAIVLERSLDLVRSVAPMWRGGGDPTMRIANDEIVRATRTPDGPATFHAVRRGDRIEVEAWGPGGEWALEVAPRALGCSDDDSAFRPSDPLIGRLRARFAGVHVTRTERVLEALLPVILEQKVTGIEARRAWAQMARAFGEPAPGPFDLLLPPAPLRVAASPYEVFHPFGVERRRAELIRLVAARAERIEALVPLPPKEACETLERLPSRPAREPARLRRLLPARRSVNLRRPVDRHPRGTRRPAA